MRLRDLPTQAHFDTSTDNLLRELILPALSASTVYDRGVGYFTSNWLRLAASGLAALATNGGRARIIASPKLSPEDCAAMAEGVSARGEPALLAALQATLEDLEQSLETETLAAMAWMVADGLLDFKLAIPTRGLDGDFHDKFGLFGDGNDAVAFRGSPNDSERAFRNYESLSVYYSWLDPREAARVAHERARFERIWTNKDLNLRVFDLPSAIRKNLIEFTQKSNRPYAKPVAPAQDPRWRHQSEAQAAFLDHRNGVLEMATGTGKTRTALSILNELHARELVDGAIVTAFGTDLLDQWRNELLKHTSFAIYVDYSGQHEALSYLNGPRRDSRHTPRRAGRSQSPPAGARFSRRVRSRHQHRRRGVAVQSERRCQRLEAKPPAAPDPAPALYRLCGVARLGLSPQARGLRKPGALSGALRVPLHSPGRGARG